MRMLILPPVVDAVAGEDADILPVVDAVAGEDADPPGGVVVVEVSGLHPRNIQTFSCRGFLYFRKMYVLS